LLVTFSGRLGQPTDQAGSSKSHAEVQNTLPCAPKLASNGPALVSALGPNAPSAFLALTCKWQKERNHYKENFNKSDIGRAAAYLSSMSFRINYL
jgi:hypothetical protein